VDSGEHTCAGTKRLLVHAGAFNLGLWMRTLCGVGTPRSLQGRVVALDAMIAAWWTFIDDGKTAIESVRNFVCEA
jgi:hypothetical protein